MNHVHAERRREAKNQDVAFTTTPDQSVTARLAEPATRSTPTEEPVAGLEESVDGAAAAAGHRFGTLNVMAPPRREEPGDRLPEHLRGRLQSSLGADLSDVRLHAGAESAAAASAVAANAYTVGQDIHFNSGRLNPDSREGQRLIAHEVAHTVQQQREVFTPGVKELAIASADDAAEVEAERFAQNFIGAQRGPIPWVAHGSLQRATIHRDTTAAPPAPAGADPQAAAVWQVPALFGGEKVTTAADASAKLIDIRRQLDPLKEEFKGIPLVVASIDKLLPETYGKDAGGPLKPDFASRLDGIGLASVGAYNVALTEMKARVKDSLGDVKEEKSAAISEKAAEILHATAFGEKADNEALEHAKDGFEKVHIYVEWAHYTNEWVTKVLQTAQSAEKFEKITEALEGVGHFGEKASIAIAALNSALAIYSAIKVTGDPGKSSTQKTVSQMKAGYSVVPVATAGAATIAGLSAAATGVGLLWTTLVPQIEQALTMIEQIDERIAASYKSDSVEEWFDEAKKEAGGSAPQIRSDQVNHFPGGQETLNFMWAVFRGAPPETAPAVVEKFFYDTRSKMNAKGEEDTDKGDEMETEWHLFRANEVKNLIPWVQRNKEKVWAMLYGSLPHP
jgi:hypothetical protein